MKERIILSQIFMSVTIFANEEIIPEAEDRPEEINRLTRIALTLSQRDHQIIIGWGVRALQVLGFMLALILLVALERLLSGKKHLTYDKVTQKSQKTPFVIKDILLAAGKCAVLLISIFFTLMYLYWRIAYSIPFDYGIPAAVFSIILLLVELSDSVEAFNLYRHLISMKDHPVPEIVDEEYPEVDIFIAAYDTAPELMEKTLNGCDHLKYPDKSKVHVWVCDKKEDSFNKMLSRTSAPYIVTLRGDMVVKSDFLLKTIPYFIQVEKKNARLGFIQTPLSFFEPDIFQYALYSVNNAPGELDFFYKTVEVSKTATNSVIYAGTNAVLSRKALEAAGGFIEDPDVADFATGVQIQRKGFLSLAISEPLASGKTPDSLSEHISQKADQFRKTARTSRKLHILTGKGLSVSQKLSYWSFLNDRYLPLKNLICIILPMILALFAVPVFKCSWADLVMLFLPMFVLKSLTVRLFSGNSLSLKWNGIYETSDIPCLFGFAGNKYFFPVLMVLSLAGVIRCLFFMKDLNSLGIAILVFWLIRNMYYLAMANFVLQGRDIDYEEVRVKDAEDVVLRDIETGELISEGITTSLTEHNLSVYLDEAAALPIGRHVNFTIETMNTRADMDGLITSFRPFGKGKSCVYTMEILDYKKDRLEYLQILYDRVPTLPQNLGKDYGSLSHLLRNIAHRILQ